MTFETTLQPGAVCPHCGDVNHDSWELNLGAGLDGSGVVTCGSCGAEYHCTRVVDVSYTTKKVEG